jgi:hypothetical protein
MDGASPEVAELDPPLAKRVVQDELPEVEICRVPIAWVRFMQATGNQRVYNPRGKSSAVAFCHERTSPGGHKRLVTVDWPDKFAFLGGGLMLDKLLSASVYGPAQASACRPLNVNPRPNELPISRYIPMPRRVFAGQSDPADASHFSIEYVWPDGLHGFIDGWLQDDDNVKLAVRSGPGHYESEPRALQRAQ